MDHIHKAANLNSDTSDSDYEPPLKKQKERVSIITTRRQKKSLAQPLRNETGKPGSQMALRIAVVESQLDEVLVKSEPPTSPVRIEESNVVSEYEDKRVRYHPEIIRQALKGMRCGKFKSLRDAGKVLGIPFETLKRRISPVDLPPRNSSQSNVVSEYEDKWVRYHPEIIRQALEGMRCGKFKSLRDAGKVLDIPSKTLKRRISPVDLPPRKPSQTNVVTKEKKKRIQHDPEKIRQALEDVRSGKFRSLRAASKSYGIPYSTLNDKMLGVTPVDLVPQTLLTTEEEKKLIDFIVKTSKKGVALTINYIRHMAAKILEKRNVMSKSKEQIPSYGWTLSLLRRYPHITLDPAKDKNKQSHMESSQTNPATQTELEEDPSRPFALPSSSHTEEPTECNPSSSPPHSVSQTEQDDDNVPCASPTQSYTEEPAECDPSSNVVTKEKKKRISHDPEKIRQALEDVRSGKFRSLRAASKSYGIPYSTLNDKMLGVTPVDLVPQTLLTTEEEKKLIDFIVKTSKKGVALTINYIRHMAAKILEKRNVMSKSKEQIPSYGWVQRLLMRYPHITLDPAKDKNKQSQMESSQTNPATQTELEEDPSRPLTLPSSSHTEEPTECNPSSSPPHPVSQTEPDDDNVPCASPTQSYTEEPAECDPCSSHQQTSVPTASCDKEELTTSQLNALHDFGLFLYDYMGRGDFVRCFEKMADPSLDFEGSFHPSRFHIFRGFITKVLEAFKQHPATPDTWETGTGKAASTLDDILRIPNSNEEVEEFSRKIEAKKLSEKMREKKEEQRAQRKRKREKRMWKRKVVEARKREMEEEDKKWEEEKKASKRRREEEKEIRRREKEEEQARKRKQKEEKEARKREKEEKKQARKRAKEKERKRKSVREEARKRRMEAKKRNRRGEEEMKGQIEKKNKTVVVMESDDSDDDDNLDTSSLDTSSLDSDDGARSSDLSDDSDD